MRCFEERLDREKHFVKVGDFQCGADDPLDIFLTDHSFEYDEEQYGMTYLLEGNENDTILGFYTIKANGIQMYDADHRRNISVPVIEIARIAVDYLFQGKGLGKKLFYDFILPRIKKVEELIAVRAVIVFVEPNNERGISFYRSLGFVKADNAVRKTVDESFNEACDLYVLSLVN